MKGESYYRQQGRLTPGSERPGLGVMEVQSDGRSRPYRRSRSKTDTALGIVAGLLIWSGVSVVLFVVYAGIVMFLRKGH